MKKIGELFKIFHPYRNEQIFLGCIIVVNILLTAFVPFLTRRLINLITEGVNWRATLETAVLIVGLALVNVAVNVTQNYRWHRLRLRAVNYLRLKMFESALKKPMAFFQKHSVGEILARVMDDVSLVAQQVSVGLPMLLANVFKLLVLVTMLLILQAKLACIVLLTIPIYYFAFNYLNKHIREASQNERSNYSLVMKDAQENILGIRTIKIFQKESYMAGKFSKTLENYFWYVKKALLYNSLGMGLTIIVMSTLPVAILLYGGLLVFWKEISLGTLFAVYTYVGYLFEPIRNLSDFNMGLQQTLGMSERVMGFLIDEQEGQDGKIDVKEFDKLEFKNVCFQYNDDNKTVLSNVSFTVEKGDRIAIIGPSGSGKSTMLNLIMRFYTPKSGSITINGLDIKEISKHSLYTQFTLLEQSNFLFDGSIIENITFGDKEKDQDVGKVAEIACVAPLVQALEKGYEHRITETGGNLSGGERQRFCLARSLIRDAGLILLDEATSSLDIGIEHEIISKLDTYMKDKTMIAISHRPRILEICNKIIHMQDGKILGVYNIASKSDLDKVFELLKQTA